MLFTETLSSGIANNVDQKRAATKCTQNSYRELWTLEALRFTSVEVPEVDLRRFGNGMCEKFGDGMLQDVEWYFVLLFIIFKSQKKIKQQLKKNLPRGPRVVGPLVVGLLVVVAKKNKNYIFISLKNHMMSLNNFDF